jgi:predicted small secreted protein
MKTLFAIAIATLVLTGCNTVADVGKDAQTVGQVAEGAGGASVARRRPPLPGGRWPDSAGRRFVDVSSIAHRYGVQQLSAPVGVAASAHLPSARAARHDRESCGYAARHGDSVLSCRPSPPTRVIGAASTRPHRQRPAAVTRVSFLLAMHGSAPQVLEAKRTRAQKGSSPSLVATTNALRLHFPHTSHCSFTVSDLVHASRSLARSRA